MRNSRSAGRMNPLRRTLVAVALVFGAVASWAQASPDVPPALAPWRDWVLQGQEHSRCPFFMAGTFGEAEQHVCAWPERLGLQAGEFGGRFTQRWQAFAPTWLPLPGDADNWPLEVRVDGAAAPVVERDGRPAVSVARGSHVVQGVFSWPERPESLAVPESVAAIDLAVDGQSIVPVQREGAALWLGRAEEVSGQADSLSVQVYRRLVDGVPPLLETRIALEVSGRGREEVIGTVLPDGWVPVRLDGSLPILLGSDGRLRAQVRPGNWQVVVVARAVVPLARVTRGEAVAAWPREEVWSFEGHPELRVATANGGRAVDPSQVGVPAEWRPLPAFVLEPGDALEVAERSRGLAGDEANRLRLEREAWLDFEGRGMSARDRISGHMVRDFRLDLEAPFALRRATAGGEPLLVTGGATTGWTGVELRSPAVDLEASSRVEAFGGALPATGWRTPFEGVATTLHLPPGRILVAAAGADASPDSWLDRWSLLDVFLLLVASLLAARLLGPAGGVLTLAALGLAHQESTGPLWTLLVVLVSTLLDRALPRGRAARVAGALRIAALVAAAFVLFPFVARQLRLALYPQLESHAVVFDFDALTEMAEMAPLGGRSQAPPQIDNAEPVAQAVVPEVAPEAGLEDSTSSSNQSLSSLGYLSRSSKNQEDGRAKAARRFQRYATMNTFQAGGGEPTWTWHTARISWSGPVLPGQTLRLWITPEWLTRVLRVVLVGLLLGLVVLLARRGVRGVGRRGEGAEDPTPSRPSPASPSPSVAAALAFALWASWSGGAAVAQSTPDPALLEQLRARLLEAPECVPSCGRLEEARVRLRGRALEVELTLHAAALVAVPLPVASGDVAGAHLEGVTIDGAPQAQLLEREGETWVPLARGVHRVGLRFRVLVTDTVDLRFPLSPGRLFVDSPGWDASGRDGYQLLTDTLSLARRSDASGTETRSGGGMETGTGIRVPPFVTVTRDLDLDLDWSARTRVTRVAPAEGSFTIDVPLLPGEGVLTPGFEARAGVVTAAFGAGVDEVVWESRLERVDRFTLTAGDLAQRAETWRVVVSPEWHADFSGLPAVRPADAETYWVHEFRPLPGESLVATVVRPVAVAGATLAIDGASLDSTIGQRAAEHTLTLTLRSTRGGQHTIRLPAAAEVLELRVDGTVLNLRPEQGALTLPIHPGPQTAVVRFRDAEATSGLLRRMPAVDLGAAASNVQMTMRLPEGRWLVATSGPQVGPAVLFWGELLAMVLGAAALVGLLRRWPTRPSTSATSSPLSFTSWLLLGLGFATASWVALAFVVAWLVAIEGRRRLDPARLSWWRFDFVQLALVGLTVIALGCLLYAVPHGLLGSPDMRVEGNGSSAHQLRWFADRTDGALPDAKAFTLPLLMFRAAMLAWALWLAASVVRWLRWAFVCLTEGGGWKKPPGGVRPQAPAAAPVPPVSS
jgi:hypothetical protein